jgi:hypothetical protein
MVPWVAFSELCFNSWFSRGWIIQDLLLPVTEEEVLVKDWLKSLQETEKIVICGNEKALWSLFLLY